MDLTLRKDDDLIISIQEDRDKKSFAELLNRYSRKLYSLAIRFNFNNETAEDIVQDFFVKFWQRPELYQRNKGAKFMTWAYRVVTNKCLDLKRKNEVLPFEEQEFSSMENYIELNFEKQEKVSFIKKMLSRLPIKQQTAMNLCFFEGLTNKEAAEVMNEDVKAVESMIFRAKRTLKDKASLFYTINIGDKKYEQQTI